MSADKDIFELYDAVVLRLNLAKVQYDPTKAMDQAILIYQLKLEEHRMEIIKNMLSKSINGGSGVDVDEIESLMGKKKLN